MYDCTMQTVAAVVAAVAAVAYCAVTVWMILVMKDSVEANKKAAAKQGEVAALMKVDLQFRVAPSLRFSVEGGTVSDRRAHITNEGRGTAIASQIEIIYTPGNRVQTVQLPNWLEPMQVHDFRVGVAPNEGDFHANMKCKDTLDNEYDFSCDSGGTLRHVSRTNRQA